jgi:hypothetical protein
MRNPIQFDHLSVLGSNLLEPAFDLINILWASNPTRPNRMQSSIVEHSYSASIILLCAAAVESCIRRIQYFHKDGTRSALEYAEKAFSDFSTMRHLCEVFTVRDSIAHNHLWLSSATLSPPNSVRLNRTELVPGFGNKRFMSVLNKKTYKTKVLRINLRPTSLCRRDVSKVLELTSTFLLYLENKDPAHASIITGRYFSLGTEHHTLPEAVAIIEKRWHTASARRRA